VEAEQNGVDPCQYRASNWGTEWRAPRTAPAFLARRHLSICASVGRTMMIKTAEFKLRLRSQMIPLDCVARPARSTLQTVMPTVVADQQYNIQRIPKYLQPKARVASAQERLYLQHWCQTSTAIRCIETTHARTNPRVRSKQTDRPESSLRYPLLAICRAASLCWVENVRALNH
jgi:hypothetical protein